MALPRRLYRFTQTTPGMLTLVSLLLALAIFAAGGAMALSSTSRQNELNELITRTEPLSNASQELFNSLSVADTLAATGFLEDGDSNQQTKKEYNQAINRASSNVVKAASGIDNIESREMELVMEIQNRLPHYVQLINEAQINDRVQNPVGAAYLTQASALMQKKVLPAAKELYTLTSGKVAEQQSRVVSPMWFPLSGLLAAVVMLIIAQYWLAAKTNRTLNIGLVLATCLMVLATLWAAVNSAATWHSGTQGVRGTVAPLEKLTEVRISAQQARTDEALGLVQRNYDAGSQEAFSKKMQEIDNTLNGLRDAVESPEHIDSARESLRSWDTAHAKMVSQIKNGAHDEAFTTALGSRSENAESTRDSFTEMDKELQDLISETRKSLQEVLVGSRTAAQHTTNAIILLTVVSATAALLGLRPRLREFL